MDVGGDGRVEGWIDGVMGIVVLGVFGWLGEEARSAVRVSIGPETTVEQIERFANAWSNAHRKFRARAA